MHYILYIAIRINKYKNIYIKYILLSNLKKRQV